MVDYVLHQAALPSVPRSIADPYSSNDNNINGTLNLLLMAKEINIKRFVFASSSSVYGFNPSIPKKETQPTIPKSPYALTKLTGETYCRLFYEQYGLKTIALRYFNIFGPRQSPHSQYAAVVPLFIEKILKDESPVIHSDGEQSRDFTYIDNVVSANLKACSAPNASGEAFNIGCGDRTTITELFRSIADIIGFKGDPEYIEMRPGDVRHSLADIDKARNILGYCSEIGIREGLLKTIAHFKNKC